MRHKRLQKTLNFFLQDCYLDPEIYLSALRNINRKKDQESIGLVLMVYARENIISLNDFLKTINSLQRKNLSWAEEKIIQGFYSKSRKKLVRLYLDLQRRQLEQREDLAFYENLFFRKTVSAGKTKGRDFEKN